MRRAASASFLMLFASFVLPPDPLTGQKAEAAASGFTLHSAPVVVLGANELTCMISNVPSHCEMVVTSPVAHGLFWPAGTTNGYMYSGGIQLSARLRMDASCSEASRETSDRAGCFPWAGDTTAALFYDIAGGIRSSATPLAGIYDSRKPEDLALWPQAATLPAFSMASGIITDSAVFHASLVGRRTASQQDTWSALWDGEPLRGASARPHPLGVLVEQRTMAWNHPEGNEATIYLAFEITNITHTAEFQRVNEAHFFDGANRLPDTGWTLDSMYFSYAFDPDVSNDAANNYFTVIPALDMMMAYHASFRAPDMKYPAAQFRPPFFQNAPGLVGLRYVRTPGDRGLTSATAFTGGGAFPVPNQAARVWRVHSNRLDPMKGDPACMVRAEPPPIFCFLGQTPSDVRGSISTGPFNLAPGEKETVIVALIVAATVETPLITLNADNRPGFPDMAPGCDGTSPRPIEVAAGWLSAGCPAQPHARTDEETIVAVPGSLIGKALVARIVADAGFALGAAPVPPPFYLVPGNGRITVVWEPSPTVASGDPFHALASDPGSELYDPSYRRDDVEGYRVYRGTSRDALELVAQFDRKDSRFVDVLCRTDPEHVTHTPCTDPRELPIVGEMVQYRSVIEMPNGDAFVVSVDTAFTEHPPLDTGVPFSYIDTDVHNGVTYYYRVTAFDFNSLKSGPSSLESAAEVKSTQPRSDATSLIASEVEVGLFGRERQLEPAAPPALDPVTGTFAGPQPPTAQLTGAFTELAGRLLQEGAAEIRIDSIVPAFYLSGEIATYHLTVGGVPDSVTFSNRTVPPIGSGVAEETVELPLLEMPSDAAERAALQSKGVDAPHIAGLVTTSLSLELPHWSSLLADWAYRQPGFWLRDPPRSAAGGSRWFSGSNETMPHPTLDEISHGRLDGVARIFQPQPYLDQAPMAGYRNVSQASFRRFSTSVLGLTRAADMRLYWGNARLDSVIDLTHNVPVPFSTAVRASHGFLPDADDDGVLTYGDFYHLKGLPMTPPTEVTRYAVSARPLLPQPLRMPVDATGDLAVDGAGFGLYIAGEPWIFQGAVPSNTTWTLRTYYGGITHEDDRYELIPGGGSAAVPGLRFAAIVHTPARVDAAVADLARVHTVPDPYYGVSAFDHSRQRKELHFVNLPDRATIRIYTVSGVLVDVINHDDPGAGGRVSWDLRGRGNNYVRSGVYLFHISTPEGRAHVGRFTVINTEG